MEEEQWWYFTFGHGQNPGIGYYAKFYGTFDSARQKMNEVYKGVWSFQYDSAEKAGVDRWNLKEWIGPQFKHDCESCIYLGHYNKHDLYYCKEPDTVVARFGNDESDYISGVVFVNYNSNIKEAVDRAIKYGYVEKPNG